MTKNTQDLLIQILRNEIEAEERYAECKEDYERIIDLIKALKEVDLIELKKPRNIVEAIVKQDLEKSYDEKIKCYEKIIKEFKCD